MRFVGKIDKKIYSCISKELISDEVIISDSQINHIKERHPNDYERYVSYFAEIVENPDYILETDKANTAFILKRIEEEGVNTQLILRLQTPQDPKGYKNSIITFLKIDQKKWDKYLRNKKILYSRE